MLIIIIRSVLLYILIVFALRLMGKKQLAQLQPSELVTTILISNIATLSLEDSTVPMIYGVIPILMIVCMDVFMSFIMLKNKRHENIHADYHQYRDSLHGCFHVFYYAQEFTLPPPCDRHTSDNHYRRHNRPQGYEAPSLQR